MLAFRSVNPPLACVVALLTCATTTQALGAPVTEVVILPVEHTNVEPELLPTLAAVLSVELEKTGHFRVTTPQDIRSLLDIERLKDVLGCEQTNCLAHVGAALGVQHALSTHVGKIGSAYVLDCSIIDLEQSKSVSRTYQSVVGGPEELIRAARRAVGRLVESAIAEPESQVVVPHPDSSHVVLTPPVLAPRVTRAAPWVIAALGTAAIIAGGVARYEASTRPASERGLLRPAGEVMLWGGVAVTLSGLLMLGVDAEGSNAANE